MSEQEKAAKTAATENEAAEVEAKKKADAEAEEKAAKKKEKAAKKKADAEEKAKAEAEAKADAEVKAAENPKQVRVICDGVLGYLGLRKGDTTDNKDYVALLNTKRGKTLVEEVK